MVKNGTNHVVNTDSRIFKEDIPFGLCILKDIAEMVQVSVPNITEAIEWHQEYMGRNFVVEGVLNEKVLKYTGAPRRFGFETIESLVEHYLQ